MNVEHLFTLTFHADLAAALGSLLAQAPAPPPPDAVSPQSQFMPILFMVGGFLLLFYFIVARPQRAEQRRREEMLNQVSKGDHVVTIGGVHGTVEAVDQGNQTVSVAIAPKVTIKVNRTALASITPRGKGKKGEAGGAESELKKEGKA